MSDLLPYQERLLRRLTEGTDAHSTLIRSPANAGVTEVLADMASRVAHDEGLVLIVTEEGTQEVFRWVSALNQIGTAPNMLRTASDFLITL